MTSSSHTSPTPRLADKERLLPLPIVILPGGRQRVSVIEARYLELITEALRHDRDFVIAFDVDGLNSPYQWGIYARIVSFDLTEEMFLLLDVEAVALLALTDCEKDARGEWSAATHYVSHWTMINNSLDTGKFSAVLRKLFTSYPQISNLYSDTYFDRIEWVCARLIEILPVPVDAKKALFKPDSFQSVISFLDAIIDDDYDCRDPNGD